MVVPLPLSVGADVSPPSPPPLPLSVGAAPPSSPVKNPFRPRPAVRQQSNGHWDEKRAFVQGWGRFRYCRVHGSDLRVKSLVSAQHRLPLLSHASYK